MCVCLYVCDWACACLFVHSQHLETIKPSCSTVYTYQARRVNFSFLGRSNIRGSTSITKATTQNIGIQPLLAVWQFLYFSSSVVVTDFNCHRWHKYSSTSSGPVYEMCTCILPYCACKCTHVELKVQVKVDHRPLAIFQPILGLIKQIQLAKINLLHIFNE